jgi:hypothetical protein
MVIGGKFNGEVEELSSIKKFPIFIGATDDPIETDMFADLTFDICKTTGMIQLRNLVDPNLVYSKFHSEAIGSTWDTHRKLLAETIKKYSDGKKILEIGGSDSKLALDCLENVETWTIIEPNIKFKYLDIKLKYVDEFFDSMSYSNLHENGYNMIVHSHVLEHSLHPAADMFAPIGGLLKDGDYHIFSVPNLYQYLKNKFVNTINFEHTLFLTEEFIDSLLSAYDFEIIEKIKYTDHSIIYVSKKNDNVKWIGPVWKYDEYKEMYLEFVDYYKKFVKDLNKVLKNTNKDIYLFGAHVFSQYLIALGLDTSKIICILDNSELKRNKRLYGTSLMIKSPLDVEFDENSLIILKVGQYRDEIKTQINKINKHIQFYE